MTASTARIDDSPAWLASLRRRLTPRATAAENATAGRVYALLAAASLALAALSLLYPSTPTYDPWAWIVWGREITQFDLTTTGGPSWKPLTVMFTTVFALFGGIAPDLWLIVARAGAFMSIFLAFRLAWRLTGGTLLPAKAIAGLIAAMALFISSSFIRNMTLGNSEGLLVAFTLWGIERHLDGRYRQAFVLGVLAALLRPEIWPFLGLYGLWLLLIDRGALKLVVICGVLVPVLWLLPEWWGSGNFWRAAERAQDPSRNSPAFADFPFWEVIKRTWPLVLTPVKAAAAFALVIAIWQWVRHRRQGAVIAVGVLALAWICEIALMTQAGFSGNPRYIILGTTLLAVVGGVGFGRAVQIASDVVARVSGDGGRRMPLVLGTGVAVCAVLLAATYHWAGPRFRSLDDLDRALRYQAQLRIDLEKALDKVGGGKRFAACGRVSTGTYQVPMVAWYVEQHTMDVWLRPEPTGVAVASRSTGAARWLPASEDFPPGYVPLVRQRTTHLHSTCGPAGS